MMATATATTTTIKVCLNVKCCATSSTNWKPGWLMRSGRIADLCDSCGLAYEQLRFCETFHADDAGWRTCNSCKKRVHCGCIASIYSFILLDTGGVECISCAKKNNSTNTNPNSINHFVTLSGQNLDSSIKDWTENIGGRFPWTTESGSWFPFPFPHRPSTPQAGVPHWQQLPETDRLVESDRIAENSTGEMTSAADSNKAEEDSNEKFKDDSKNAEVAISVQPTRLDFLDGDSLREDAKANIVDVDAKVFTDSDAAKDSNSQEHFVTGNVDAGTSLRLGKPDGQVKSMPENAMDFHDSSALAVSKVLDPAMDQLEPHPSSHLAMSLGLYPAKDDASEANERAGSSAPTTFTGSAGTQGDSRDHVKFSGLSSVRHRQRQLLPKPPQSQPATRAEISKESSLQVPIRVARPPGEGRGRNQLLPRYWPRITDQELQQITSGGSNSTITPLFEKMLSASDAGRIGRLVLPKACAEAYFPSISQPEGLPLKIQDVSGKEWVFQFRFWPNNNSRMYVLEGVTPCIQSMQLQAGDTVTFSRLDPEGKLVMGYRRAPNSLSTQDVQTSTTGTSTAAAHLDAGGIDNIPTITGLSGLLPQSLKSGSEPQFNGLSGKFNMAETGYGWFKSEKAGTRPKEGALYQSLLLGDRRKGRHLGSKSKRLRMEVEESIELKLSWEEAQDLLRPPPNIVPNIVTIDGHEFEEYEEPPVFGKRTIFTTRQSGLTDDQWAQCDDCGSWRKVPPDVFLPTRWTCADNAWDSKRAACIAPQEVNSEEIENLLRHTKDVKKQEDIEPLKVNETSSGLDALANAATLGDNNTASSSSPAPTTKHPRHRPGCTCIVCIQPPSGKGPKHKPTCVCNVCMTVKRRFKTLMMRRKKRQTEREAETARKKRAWVKEEGEVNSGTKWRNDTYSFPENGSRQGSLAATFPGSLPRINSFSANGNGFTSSVALTSTYPSRAKAAGEECLASKGHIDLNSKPERDDEQSKGTGRQSMVRLLQNASYPLDKYMKQQGLTSLICPQQMLVAPMGFARNVSSRRVDEYTGSQSALLTPDKSQEEPFLVLGGARGDTATSAQSFEIMERKSSIQVPNQSS